MNHEPTLAKVQLTDGLGPAAEARWYAVTKSGLATLCASERDAMESAASFDVSYPHSAPHRAVLLGDVAAERERCASICDGIGAGYTGAARRLDGQHATHAAGQRDGANECAAEIRRA